MIEIPDRAVQAAYDEYIVSSWSNSTDVDICDIAAALKFAAPIIIAAELRRLAVDPLNLFSSDSDIDVLCDRADELDPS